MVLRLCDAEVPLQVRDHAGPIQPRGLCKHLTRSAQVSPLSPAAKPGDFGVDCVAPGIEETVVVVRQRCFERRLRDQV